MSGFVTAEKGVPIRMPSVANLMVDSADRNGNPETSPWEFQISKNNNLQNGFFTRIAATEMVLEWCNPNITAALKNSTWTIDISGTGSNTYVDAALSGTIPDSFYTVEEAVDTLVDELNDLTGTTGATFSVVQVNPGVRIDCSGAEFVFLNSGLGAALELNPTESPNLDPFANVGICPDLRAYRYLDFVSEQLTYAQDVKDAATNAYNRNVLLRWYFSEDVPEMYDSYGYPILMGYKPFNRRRIFNPPKQIRWNTDLPVGNLIFQVYGNDNKIVPAVDNTGLGLKAESNWLMTLQLSEV